MSSSLHQPKPLKSERSSEIGVQSARLLSPHQSVLETLNNVDTIRDNNQINSNLVIERVQAGDGGFSTTSWQAIGSHWGTRSTSSVLSSSDTEEDQVSLAISSTTEDKDKDIPEADDKTIEIDMNSGVKLSNSGFASGFMLPNIVKSPIISNNSNFPAILQSASPLSISNIKQETCSSSSLSQSKVLVIGNKKTTFLRELNSDKNLDGILTLDFNEPFEIVIVIFDGLIKIGNILNFIKQNQIQDKLIIPLFKNINQKTIEKILHNYELNLLCSPISLEDKFQISNLLRIVKDDETFMTKSLMNAINDVETENDDYLLANYQMINSHNKKEENDSSLSSSISSIDSSFDILVEDSNTVIIQHHHNHENTHSNSRSKRIKKYKKSNQYLLVGLAFTIGIGIGFATALTMTYFENKSIKEQLELQKSITSSPVNSISLAKKFLKSVKSNIKSLFIFNPKDGSEEGFGLFKSFKDSMTTFLSNFKVSNSQFSNWNGYLFFI